MLFRLRFQFSLLSLLVLILAVALPFAWSKVNRIIAESKFLGGRLTS